MKIEILYFAYLREQLGFDREEAETPDDVRTVGALRDWLVAKGEPYATAFANLKRIRAALNEELASDDEALKEGDVVAFFPPVTLRMTKRVPTISTAPMIRQMTASWTKPAIMKFTKLTAATVMA